MNYNKNQLINECLCKYYETFSHTLDTADFVPEKFNDKILDYIFKNMRRAFKKIDKENKVYLKGLEKKQSVKVKQIKAKAAAEKKKAAQESKQAKKENAKMKKQAKQNKKKNE
jgi:outer membrane protein assembly factor BamE (lipoprotein component of BamABCDE complex)